MKIDKFDLFITVVWVVTMFLICRVMSINVDLQSEIGSKNREIEKLKSELCPQLNYNSKSCQEYKEDLDRFKVIEDETEEEFRERVFGRKERSKEKNSITSYTIKEK